LLPRRSCDNHSTVDVEELNDRLAREHPIDDYYDRSSLPIRLIEQRRLAIIRDFVGPSAGLEIAEVGAGGGHVLRLFPEARLTAFDVSEVFLATAKKNLAGLDVRFVKGEIDKLGLEPASFDRVICTEVLEHTENPEAILATIATILRPNGVAVITVPNDPLIMRLKGTLRRTPLGWILRNKIDWGGDEFHLHAWSPAEFESLLSRHFRVVAQRHSPSDRLPIRACFRCVPR
jgi:2-polyprenyl-3-methyl-5-hydroxy-6-metoxy-1,4-benzoquinol methylase